MLIVLITYLISLSIAILIALHIWIHCYTLFDLTCRFSRLYILLIIFWAWCSYHYSSWLSRLVCIHEWYILYSAWLYDAWLSSLYMIACRLSMWVALLSPTSNSLGFGHSFHLGSHYCKCETFCVLALWPSQRLGVGSSDGLYQCTGAFWRRPTYRCWLESDHWRPV